MIRLRSAIFQVWLFAVIAVMAVVCAPTMVLPRPALTKAQKVLARLLLGGLRVICGVRIEVRGLEHRPAEAALIAAKHQSQLDGIAPLVFLHDPSFVLKRELMSSPVTRAYGRKAELIGLDREGGTAALKMLTADVRDRLAKGRPTIIFPEGARRPPGAAPDYKPGVAGLYREIGGPVTPMGTTSGLRWPKGWIIRPGVAVYEFLEPIGPGLKRGAFMAELEARIETATDALLAEARPRRMTDAPARRSSRAWLLIPPVLVAVAAGGWCAYWFVARDRLLSELEAQIAAHREEGRTVEWRARRVEGFPYRFKLVFDDFRLASPSGWTVEAPRFEAQANAYQLTRWVGVAPQGLTLVRPVAGPVRIDGRVLRAGVGGVGSATPRVSLEGADVRFTPLAGSEPFFLAGAERVEAHLRPAPDAEDTASLLLRLRGARPRPAGVVAFVSGNQPANFVWDSRVTEVDELNGEDWEAAMRAWSQAGGRMEIREATLQAGELRARNAGGTLSVGAGGRLRGRVVVALNRPLQALSALTRIEQTDPAALGAATAITEAQREANVELALGFEAGVTTIGPVAIGPAPKVF